MGSDQKPVKKKSIFLLMVQADDVSVQDCTLDTLVHRHLRHLDATTIGGSKEWVRNALREAYKNERLAKAAASEGGSIKRTTNEIAQSLQNEEAAI